MSNEQLSYREESQNFINAAFDLLDKYKRSPYDCNNDTVIWLTKPYALRINAKGQISLVRIISGDHRDRTILVGHTFAKCHTSITHIGKLLTVYLDNLQNDRGDNICRSGQ